MLNPLAWLQRLSLRYQVALGIMLIFLLLLGVFSYLANQAIQRSVEVAKEERLKLAETTAASIDALVTHATYQLNMAAGLLRVELLKEEVSGEDLRRGLESRLWLLFHALGTYSELVLSDYEGKVLWYHPQAWDSENISNLPVFREATQLGQMILREAALPLGTEHPPVAVVAVPILFPDVSYIVVGTLHLSHMGMELISLPRGSPTFVTQVIDSQGVVLASSLGLRRSFIHGLEIDQHMPLLETLIKSRQPGVKIHRTGGGGHLVAFAPLSTLGGGVIVEEQVDRALAVPQELQRTLFVFGFLSLLMVSLAAWGHARYVIRPLTELQRATQRIAAGELDGPITLSRQDEVGKLAQSFEGMRVRLEVASQERAQFESQMENRVRERTQEVHRLLGKIITVQEDERKRLARELHDETAQALATLMVSIEALHSSLPPEETRAKELLQKALTQGKAALSDLRRMILDLRPSALDDLGFADALHSYAQVRLAAEDIRVNFDTLGTERRLPGPVETALFRILQEAVNNTARHSRAKKALLQLEFRSHHFRAVVEDDGVGFDPATLLSEAGVGLQGMRERAELIGAHLEIDSRPGAGTRIRVELPLKEEDE